MKISVVQVVRMNVSNVTALRLNNALNAQKDFFYTKIYVYLLVLKNYHLKIKLQENVLINVKLKKSQFLKFRFVLTNVLNLIHIFISIVAYQNA